LQNAVNEKHRPCLIIGHTIMGFGALSEAGEKMEGLTSEHGQPLSKAGVSVEKTILNLGGDPAKPFEVFPEVREYYRKVLDEKRKSSAAKKAAQQSWEKANPELAATWKKYITNSDPGIDYAAIPLKPNAATRNTSGDVLAYFSAHLGNMIVISADLSNRRVPQRRGIGADHGRRSKRHCPAWWSICGLRHLLCFFGFHETCHPPGCPDAPAGKVCFYARLFPCGGRWPNTPAGRTGNADPFTGKGEKPPWWQRDAGSPAGGRSRNDSRLENGSSK
jgi:hypothetical protein